jgi:hypothetical protein
MSVGGSAYRLGGESRVVALPRVAARTELAISATPRAPTASTPRSKYHSAAGSADAARLRCICATRTGPCAVQRRCGPYVYAAVRAERGSAARGAREPAGAAACGRMDIGSASYAPACTNTTAGCKMARCNHQCSGRKQNTELRRQVGGESSAELTSSGFGAAAVRLLALTAGGV